MGNPSPGYPGVPPLVFRPYVLFSLYNNNSIGPFEKRDNKNLRKKILKNTTLCKTSNPVDPAKRGSKRTRNELAMLDFCPDEK